MVDATLQAGIDGRRSARISVRAQLGWFSAVADVVSILGGYLAAEAIRAFALPALGVPGTEFSFGWTAGILVAVIVSVFYAWGLYEPEAFVSRSLHFRTLLKTTLATFALSALSLYVISDVPFEVSRFVLPVTFVLFMLFDSALRLGVVDLLGGAWVWRHKPVSVLVGDSEMMRALEERLAHLRWLDHVERIAPEEMALDAEESLRAVIRRCLPEHGQACAVFVDAQGLTPRAVYRTVSAGQSLGAEVYVVSGLLEALQGNRLLGRLFGVPVIRVRGSIESAKPYPLKRVLDVIGSAALLLLSAPLIAVLGVMIRVTSPGPVFYKQTRVGRFGVPFEFVKLRSMVMNGDEGIHSEYVRAFMNGTAEAVTTGNGGDAIFKKVDDPRITRVGKFVRKYSLDEIPQFWNVFRGDMSLVGPRPPLPYEVNEYDDWDSLRLTVPAGITGLWQVEGRSRVSFDEMILQDVMYAHNMRLLVDIALCLRTLPATLLGGGGG